GAREVVCCGNECNGSSAAGCLRPISAILIPRAVCASLLEARAVCGKSARTDPRGGYGESRIPTATKFFRCEAPFLLRHEIECRITPSLPAQTPWTPPRLRASSQAAPLHPSHPYLGLYGRAMWKQPAWPVASSESPESRGPSRTHS